MAELRTYQVNLELKETFRISHSSRDVQPTLITVIRHAGLTGLGEAAATSYYGIRVSDMQKKVEEAFPMIEDTLDEQPEVLWDRLNDFFIEHTFAQSALDIALHDLHGHKAMKPIYALWGLSSEKMPLSSYTIGIDTPDKMLKKMLDFPWPVYKIKLGTSEDVAIVRELRRHSKAVFRVDANGAWNPEQTINNAAALEKLGVELIEQPLPPGMESEMKRIMEHSKLPLIADESCKTLSDVDRCAKGFHGINIKLPKCGGLTPARRMIQAARAQGLKVMIGCMTESSIGISAAAQLLPLADYADIDGSLLIKNDIADGVMLRDAKVKYPFRNGTGARLLKPIF